MKKKFDVFVAFGIVGIVSIMASGCFRLLSMNPLEPTVKYVVGDEMIAKRTYSIFTGELTSPEPEVPQKEHYSASWEKVDFNGGNKVVKAVYSPIEYTITYVKDGAVVGGATYTVESKSVELPMKLVSDKEGYTYDWETFELDGGDKTVNAVYTPIEYTITYVPVCDGLTEKYGTDLFGEFWRQMLWLEENGKIGDLDYPQTYTIETGYYCPRLLDESSVMYSSSSGYELFFDGYFADEACTIPIGYTQDGRDGGWYVDGDIGTMGDITLYLKFTNLGGVSTWPW